MLCYHCWGCGCYST